MFYDNRVNQIRERRRVIQKIRSQIEAYEAGDPDCDFDPDAEMPSPYLQLKVRNGRGQVLFDTCEKYV